MSILTKLFGPAKAPAPTVDTDTDVVRAIILRCPGLEKLTLVKMLYLVQVLHLGRYGERLFPDWFQATTIGPYNADLAYICRYRLNRARYDAAHMPEPCLSPRVRELVEGICDELGGGPAARLQTLTSLEGGAWHRLWRPDPRLLLPISDPRSRIRHRRPTDTGPVIDIEHMMFDYAVMTDGGEQKAA